MNIEELKSDWAVFNHRIEQSAILSQQLVESMIRERSRSRVSRIRQESRMLVCLMVAELLLFIAIVAGNPFDFNYYWQFVPFLLLAGGAVAAIWSLSNTLRHFGHDVNDGDLAGFLHRIISAYDKNKTSHTWFVAILFSAGALTAVSFLPHKLETKEFWPAIGETLISICVSVVIYYLAFRGGAFKSRKKPGFENDLQELNQLRVLADDLNAPVKVS